MTQPEALTKNEPLFWSTGNAIDAWNMFCAAATGNLQTIKELLQKDPSLIRSAYDYRNAMSFAVRENQVEVVKYLLSQNANPVNSGTDDTLLQIAKDRGYTAIEKLLEDVINSKTTPSGSLMAEIIKSRDIEKLRSVLNESPELIHAKDGFTNQPIHWAVMTRQPEMINELLDRGADINAKRFDGARPLQLTNGDYGYRGWRDVPNDTVAKPNDIYILLVKRGAYVDLNMAALKGDIKRVRELLENDPSLVNKNDEYVSYYPGSGSTIKNAVLSRNIEMVKLLIDYGADVNLPEEHIAPKGHALHSAVYMGEIEIVKLLLEHGAYPSVEIESSADTLSAAIANKDEAMIELLCSYGAASPVALLAYYGDIKTAAAVFAANPSKADDAYALECAAGQGHGAFVRLMLLHQPELAKKIAVGVASQAPQDGIRSTALTEFLFQHGMNANYKNWLGVTPLHQFAKRNDLISAELFIKHGANVNAIDDEFYSTPLGYAAKYNKKEMIELLLQHNADPNLPVNIKWAKPLAWTLRRGYKEIETLLKEHGANIQ